METFENSTSVALSANELIIQEYKEKISVLQQETYSTKNQLAVTQEILRRYKLNDITELAKELKDLQECLNIMKENAEVQNLTILTQQYEIEKLTKSLQSFEKEKVNSPEKEKVSNENREPSKAKIEKEISDFLETNKKSSLENSETKKNADGQIRDLEGKCDDLLEKLNKRENDARMLGNRYAQAAKKIENMLEEKKCLIEKISELENDKKKLLEKWQNSLGKAKNADQQKSRIKDLEYQLEAEKKKSDSYLLKLKESSKRLEEFKELYAREKSYSEELTASYKKLHVQSKVLFEEKELLNKMNQELSVKFHTSISEHNTPDKWRNNDFDETINSLQKELNQANLALKIKNQELIQLELKLFEFAKRPKDSEFSHSDQILSQKYESLLEKYQKLQYEKNQIQNLYIASSTVISERNNKIHELTTKLCESEDKLLLASQKINDGTKPTQSMNSVNNTTTSRSTNKSSPRRSKTPGDPFDLKILL